MLCLPLDGNIFYEIHGALVLSLWRPSVCVFRAEVGRAASLCGRQVTVECRVTTAAQMVMLTPSTTLPSVLSLKQGGPPTSASPAPVWWPSLWQGPAWEAHYLWLVCMYHLTHLTTVFIINEVVYVCVRVCVCQQPCSLAPVSCEKPVKEQLLVWYL